MVTNKKSKLYLDELLKRATTLCGFTLLLFSSLGISQNKDAFYHWYHDGNKIPLTVIPNKVIRFSEEESNSAVVDKALKPQRTKKLTGGGQLLELTETSYSNFMNSSQKIMNSVSPLFKEGGSIKALPGGIIVSFKPGVSENEIQFLCEIYHLKLKKRYSSEDEPAVWLIETDAGLESLRLSNLFRETHNQFVQSARPNFWQPINTKELKFSDGQRPRVVPLNQSSQKH